MSASYPGYGPAKTSESTESASGPSHEDSFSKHCLNVLDGDESGVVHFCSEDYSQEILAVGMRRLENRGFLVEISIVSLRNRSNPRFDRKVKISKKKGARS